MPLRKNIEEFEGEDTEGNRIKLIRISEGTDEFEDTEGNRFHGIIKDGVDELEDTEGNRIKLIRLSEGDDDGDDTEGHRIKLIR